MASRFPQNNGTGAQNVECKCRESNLRHKMFIPGFGSLQVYENEMCEANID
jgi:hypothetical protein